MSDHICATPPAWCAVCQAFVVVDLGTVVSDWMIGPVTSSSGTVLTASYWNGQQWVAMSGTAWPTPATTEPLTCAMCGTSVPIHPEADVPEDWREFAIPCGMQAWCPQCITEAGGLGPLRRNAEERHRDNGGCASCAS